MSHRIAAAFLDRDGTLIEDGGYVGRPDQVALIPGADAGVRRLNEAGVPVAVITNQSGIGRGLFAEGDLERVHRELERQLTERGARIDAFYVCPHAPADACRCRKPSPEMFERAAEGFGVALENGLFVGDRRRDLLAGLEHGGLAFLVGKHAGESVPSGARRAPDLRTAVDLALADRTGPVKGG